MVAFFSVIGVETWVGSVSHFSFYPLLSQFVLFSRLCFVFFCFPLPFGKKHERLCLLCFHQVINSAL